jgi:hypothetical protein
LSPARERAESAPQLLQPGLLASQIPGGVSYVGVTGASALDGVLAADRNGYIASVSLGPASTLPARVATASRHQHLVVADLPGGEEGRAELLALSESRPPSELLLVVERVASSSAGQLLWSAAAGLSGGGFKELRSPSTEQRGLIASFDLAPTILAHLGETPSSQMRGRAIVTDGPLRSSSLRRLMARLQVIGSRRLKALGFLLCTWALLMVLAAPRPRARACVQARSGFYGHRWRC